MRTRALRLRRQLHNIMAERASGMSKSHDNTSARSIAIFDEYGGSTAARRKLLPKAWAELDEATLCKEEVWDGLADFLTTEYKSEKGLNAGDFLDYSTVEGYFNSALKLTSARFK